MFLLYLVFPWHELLKHTFWIANFCVDTLLNNIMFTYGTFVDQISWPATEQNYLYPLKLFFNCWQSYLGVFHFSLFGGAFTVFISFSYHTRTDKMKTMGRRTSSSPARNTRTYSPNSTCATTTPAKTPALPSSLPPQLVIVKKNACLCFCNCNFLTLYNIGC